MLASGMGMTPVHSLVEWVWNPCGMGMELAYLDKQQ